MLNMQLDQSVAINTGEMEWEASPMSGVWRKPLAREAAEHGHTTSVVRFDAGSYFSPHDHPLGEEILVLQGVFSDEHGDYPAGTYLRNPPASRHKPYSEPGCELLVKLDQFDEDDSTTLRLNTHDSAWMPGESKLEIIPLHDFEQESVFLLKWPPDTRLRAHSHYGGEEIFVLSGELFDEYGCYPAGTWLRNPHNSEHCPYTTEETILWVKSGHLLP
ncbi:MAG: cupin [Gammaproteobacteria bacterium]|nr:cupin [Gammaproteobacteria bacterium]MCP4979900.1 cupin [Gammaproteobacteria bacterium]